LDQAQAHVRVRSRVELCGRAVMSGGAVFGIDCNKTKVGPA